ncbi:MAG TPA: RNA methyltransferase, partial [Baekduia sp.]|nr:RNA methyltransferase [Baekduia sp.]
WRDKLGLFAAEGEDLVDEATAAGWEPLQLLRADREVSADALAKVSGLASGSRVIAVYEERFAAPAGPLCVALWGVKDPGNVGTVLRSALAFGASSVALGPGTADPFSPKAVRASMGAIFRVPVCRVASIEELPGKKIALVAGSGDRLIGPASEEMTIVIGPERNGIADAALAACDGVAHIPIANESLNAAVAGSVALYELTRGTADLTASDPNRVAGQ